MINALIIDAFMTGVGMGLSYVPLVYLVVYAVNELWKVFGPRGDRE